jgi:gliding motility-associated-like protein
LKTLTTFLFLFSVLILKGQNPQDNCNTASQVCYSKVLSVNNQNATANAIPAICFTSTNTIWISFFTNNIGGDVNVEIQKSLCQGANIGAAILSGDCSTATFNQLYCGVSNTAIISANASGLSPLTQYYLVINSEIGGNSIDCSFSVSIAGSGVETLLLYDKTDAICFQSPGRLEVTGGDFGSAPYSYTLNGITQTNTEFEDLLVGDHILYVTNQTGCTYEFPFSINGLNNTVVVDAGDDKFIIGGSDLKLETSGNGTAFFWDPPDFIDDVNAASPTVNPTATITYRVFAFSPEGCYNTDEVIVNVLPIIYIPNAFTPNADGTNDTWKIFNIEKFPESELEVYNRWGQRIYKIIGYGLSGEWDGKSGNKDLPASTYYYILNLNAKTGDPESEIYRGSVTIIR